MNRRKLLSANYCLSLYHLYAISRAKNPRPAQPGHEPQYQMDTTGPHTLKIFRFCFESWIFALSLCDPWWRIAANFTLTQKEIDFPAIFSVIFAQFLAKIMSSGVALLIAHIFQTFWEIRAPFRSPGPGYFATSAPPPPPPSPLSPALIKNPAYFRKVHQRLNILPLILS